MVVVGDYTLGAYKGTEQYSKPLSLIPHPQYNRSTNNADIMLIKVRFFQYWICHSQVTKCIFNV